MPAVAVSAASKLREARWKHKGAFDEPRAKHFCRDFLSNLRDATGREAKRPAESESRRDSRAGRGDSGTISTIQKSQSRMAVEESVTGLPGRVHAAFA